MNAAKKFLAKGNKVKITLRFRGREMAHMLSLIHIFEQTLNVFGVNAKVNNISCGPAVTRFEITPELGVKVSKIVNLADDITVSYTHLDVYKRQI